MATALDNMYILISTADGKAWYVLMQQSDNPEENASCVKSYELTGGVTQPFEHLLITLSQRRLAQMIPDEPRFIDYITPSKTQLLINSYGHSRFIVSKVRVGGKGADRTCEIEAYSHAQQYQSSTLKYNMSDRPSTIINDILGSDYGQLDTPLKIPVPSRVLRYDVGSDFWLTTPTFSAGTNVWRVLQICALKLGCKIWFEGEKVYVVDFRNANNTDVMGDIRIHSVGNDISQATLGTAEIRDDGIDSVNNTQPFTYGASNTAFSYRDDASFKYYGERVGRSLALDEITDVNDAEEIAKGLVEYRADMQRSIKFTVKELSQHGWVRKFEPICTAPEIRDEDNNMIIDNISPSASDYNTVPPTVVRRPQYLFLSEYTRHYPESYTDYTWGKVANVDLPQALSSLMGK